MSDDSLPEPDRIDGAPHPRETRVLVGQGEAEAAFLDAYNGGRMHHAWLITGPRGVGKATLAWRLARFLLAQPSDDGGMFGAPEAPATLDIPEDHPVTHRIDALSEPGLFLLRRPRDDKTHKLKTVITIDEARALKRYLSLSSADAGRRVVIIDAADDMNTATSNAILKLLEEPPARTTLLLVCHAPARLLPTIRSRCRTLRCGPLGPAEMEQALAAAGQEIDSGAAALAELSGGSVGEATRLLQLGGPKLYSELVALLATCPRLDRQRLVKLADGMGGAANAEKYDTLLRLIDMVLARLARHGAGHPPLAEAAPGEAEMLARLAPGLHAAQGWAALQQTLGAKAAHGRAVNLDPSTLILDTVLSINETAAELAPA